MTPDPNSLHPLSPRTDALARVAEEGLVDSGEANCRHVYGSRHLRGALNSGASPDQIPGTLAAAAELSPEAALESAMGELNRIMETTACS